VFSILYSCACSLNDFYIFGEYQCKWPICPFV